MIDFKKFYDHVYFDVSAKPTGVYRATQGDKNSRGFYVTILQDGIVVPFGADEFMFAIFTKPDNTKVRVDAVAIDGVFRVDITPQVLAAPGRVICKLVLVGPAGEQISDDSLYIFVDANASYGSVISTNELSEFETFLIDYENMKQKLDAIIDRNVEGVSQLEIELARRGEPNLWRKMIKLEEADAANDLSEPLNAHTSDTVKHITGAERTAWNSKETTSGALTKAREAVELSAFTTVKSEKDTEGIFKIIKYFRKADNKLAMKSTLSGGTSPKYTTRTVIYYGTNGSTVVKTDVFTLTYDADGVLISEV